MHTLFLHSDVDLATLGNLLPNARLFIPCADGLSMTAPFLVRVETPDDFSITQQSVLFLESQGAGVTSLPHPRDKKQFGDAQVAKLQKHTPKTKKGDTMADLLGNVHSVCPEASWDPSLHCF